MVRKLFWIILTLIFFSSLGLLAWSLSEGGKKNFTPRVDFSVKNKPIDTQEKTLNDDIILKQAADDVPAKDATSMPTETPPTAAATSVTAYDEMRDPLSIAVIVTGMGLDQKIYKEITSLLPKNIAVAFSVYSPELEQQVRRARRQGYETYIEIPVPDPMKPRQDLGPLAITPYLEPEMKTARIKNFLPYKQFIDGFISIVPDMWLAAQTTYEKIKYIAPPDFAINENSSKDTIEQQIQAIRNSTGTVLVFVPAKPGLVKRLIENVPQEALTAPSKQDI